MEKKKDQIWKSLLQIKNLRIHKKLNTKCTHLGDLYLNTIHLNSNFPRIICKCPIHDNLGTFSCIKNFVHKLQLINKYYKLQRNGQHQK